MYRWLSDFISNREYIVSVSNEYSDSVHFNAGVPQGSVLGSLLFSIDFNSCCSNITNHVKFADDLVIWRTSSSVAECVTQLNFDLKCIEHWSRFWKLQFNAAKSMYSVLELEAGAMF